MAIRNLIANIMHIFDRIKVTKTYKIINFEIFLELLSRYLYQEDNIWVNFPDLLNIIQLNLN